MTCTNTYTGPGLHEWQSLVQLAAKLGAQPAHVINAIDRGQRCMGHYLTRRNVTPQDTLDALGLDARTKTLYRVSRFDEEIERLSLVEVKLTTRLRELRRVDISAADDEPLDDALEMRMHLYHDLGLLRRTRARLRRAEVDADAGQQALL